jgi:arylsulfatase A-like enzyme
LAAETPLVLLGIVLPLMFLSLIDQYLYYLRPVELLPTYGTAWLMLALPVLPAWVILALTLKMLGARAGLRVPLRLTELVLRWVAVSLAVSAIMYAALAWLRTFGLFLGESVGPEGTWISIGLGALIVVARLERVLWEYWRLPAIVCASIGALSVASVPFFGWENVTGASAPISPPGTTQNSTSALAASHSSPNIVLLTIDALSAEHMSLYGAARRTTPELTLFAQGAMTFDHAYANANFTTPGISSILTGTRPWTHRALQLQTWPIPETRRDSLPALLDRRGYQMGYVSTNPIAGARQKGLGAYFDFASTDRVQNAPVLMCSDGVSLYLRYSCPASQIPLFTGFGRLETWLSDRSDNRAFDPALAIQPAVEWLHRVDKTRPVFLWVHLLPPHSPYAAPEPWLGMYDQSKSARTGADSEATWGFRLSQIPAARVHVLAARYDESVAYVDHYAGEFLQRTLQTLGENTAVVVTADHGESFGHSYGAHTGPALYNEIIHIPLLVKLPGQHHAMRSSATVEQADIAPTLAALAGIKPPSSWEGRSLLPEWHSSEPPDRPAFSMNFEENRRFSGLTTGSVAVIDGRWKLVHYMGKLHYPLMPPLHDELYDLSADPGELDNLAADNPAEVSQLRGLIEAQLALHGGPVQ